MAVTGFGVCSAKPFLLEMRRGKPRSKMTYNEKMELRCPRLLSSPFPTGQPQGETSAQQSLGGFPWDYQVPSPPSWRFVRGTHHVCPVLSWPREWWEA